MKNFQLFQSALLSLMLTATATVVYAQHDDKHGNQDRHEGQGQPSNAQRGQDHGGQNQRGQDQHAQQSQQQDRGDRGQQQHAQQQQQRPQYAPAQRQQEQPRGQAQQRQQPDQKRNNWEQHRASNFASQHQTWAQRGGYQGFRIPEARFGGSFGRQHSFHVYGLPYMEQGGQARFQYGGYWFSMMEPYPEYWGTDWYRNDDMYVDYDGGGYYLYDRRYSNRPGVAISISF